MEKTRAQLIDELEGMRERVAVLEAQEADHKRIKASLRDSEERYRTLFAEAPASVTIIDTSGIVVDCNEATAALTGFSEGEIAGKRFDELMTLDPKDLPKLMESHERNIRGEDVEPFDLEIIRKDGSRRWILVKVSLFKRRGKTTGIQIYAIDITERRQAQAELRIKDDAIASSINAVALSDLDGKLTYVNSSFLEMWGYVHTEDVLGSLFKELWLREQQAAAVWEATLKKGGARGELAARRADGSTFTAELSISLVTDDDDKPLCIMGSFIDMTERKVAEEERDGLLRQLDHRVKELNCLYGISNILARQDASPEERFRGILELIPPAWQYPDITCARITIEGKRYKTGNFKKTGWIQAQDITVHGERVGTMEVCYLEERPEAAEGPFLEEERHLIEAIAGRLGEAIERKRVKEALQDSEEKLRIMSSSITDGIVLTDMEANIIKVNNSMLRMGKYKNEKELVGRNALDFVSPKDRARAMKNLRKEIAEGHSIKPVEYTLLASDGSGFAVESSAAILCDNSGNPVGLVNVIRDITERKVAEEALRESEEMRRLVLDNTDASINYFDAEGIIKLINRKSCELLGWDPKDAVGRSIYDMFPKEVADFHMQRFSQIIKEGEGELFEDAFELPQGTSYFLSDMQPMRDVSGKVVGVQIIANDITERRRDEQMLTQAKVIIDNMEEALVLFDMGGSVSLVNSAYEKMTGYKGKALIGTSGAELTKMTVVERELDKILQVFRQALKGVKLPPISTYLKHKDGGEVPVEFRVSFVRDEQGKAIQIVAVITDITKRKQAEDVMRESEEKMRAMFEASPDFIMDADREGKLLFINRTVPELTMEETIGTSMWDFIAPEAREAHREAFAKVFKSGEAASIETAGLGPGGRISYYRTRFSPIMHGDQVDTVMLISTDVTEQMRAEEELRKSEEKLRFMFESLGDGIIVVDLEGRVEEVNEAALVLAGCKKKKDMVGRNVFDFVADKDRARALEENSKNLMEGHGSAVEYTAVDINGQEFDVESTGALMRDSSGNPVGFITAVRDVTERKRIEEALRTSEEKLRIMFESITDGIIVTDLVGNIIDINEAELHLHGYSNRKELIGRKGLELMADEYQSMVIEKMFTALEEGGDATMEYVLPRPDGLEVDVEGVVNLLHDSAGNPIGLVVITRDITERKRAEENLKLYVKEITRAQEEERKRIARDLHDETVQELAALTLDIEATKRADKRLSEDTVNALERIQDKSRSIMEGVNRFSAELRPDILDQMGLLSALSWLVEKIGDDVDVRVELSGDERRLSAEVELALFRVAQEALSNVRKHSEAVNAVVKVAFTTDGVWLEVRDYGKGFVLPDNIADLAAKGHLGILGMHERARIIDGTVSVRSRPDEGTSVSIVV